MESIAKQWSLLDFKEKEIKEQVKHIRSNKRALEDEMKSMLASTTLKRTIVGDLAVSLEEVHKKPKHAIQVHALHQLLTATGKLSDDTIYHICSSAEVSAGPSIPKYKLKLKPISL